MEYTDGSPIFVEVGPNMVRPQMSFPRILRKRRTQRNEAFAELDEALSKRELLWQSALTASADAMRDLPSPSLRHSQGITLDNGDGDAFTRSCVQGGQPQMTDGEDCWAARTRVASELLAPEEHVDSVGLRTGCLAF